MSPKRLAIIGLILVVVYVGNVANPGYEPGSNSVVSFLAFAAPALILAAVIWAIVRKARRGAS